MACVALAGTCVSRPSLSPLLPGSISCCSGPPISQVARAWRKQAPAAVAAAATRLLAGAAAGAGAGAAVPADASHPQAVPLTQQQEGASFAGPAMEMVDDAEMQQEDTAATAAAGAPPEPAAGAAAEPPLPLAEQQPAKKAPRLSSWQRRRAAKLRQQQQQQQQQEVQARQQQQQQQEEQRGRHEQQQDDAMQVEHLPSTEEVEVAEGSGCGGGSSAAPEATFADALPGAVPTAEPTRAAAVCGSSPAAGFSGAAMAAPEAGAAGGPAAAAAAPAPAAAAAAPPPAATAPQKAPLWPSRMPRPSDMLLHRASIFYCASFSRKPGLTSQRKCAAVRAAAPACRPAAVPAWY